MNADSRKTSNLLITQPSKSFQGCTLELIEWDKQIPAFTKLSLDEQAKLIRASWYEQYTLKVLVQLGTKIDQDHIEINSLVVLQMMCQEATYLHHLNVDWVETACLNGNIMFNLGMHILAVSKLKAVMLDPFPW